MNITVYLGSAYGNDPVYREEIRKLGQWIGESGNTLVYGGSRCGLMGELAESVLSHNGHVIGVEPRCFLDEKKERTDLDQLIVTSDIPERRRKMIELGGAFIAFPGGTGTLEEISEVIARVCQKQLNAPCILYNLNGYYDDLLAMLKKMAESGFSDSDSQKGISSVHTLSSLHKILENSH